MLCTAPWEQCLAALWYRHVLTAFLKVVAVVWGGSIGQNTTFYSTIWARNQCHFSCLLIWLPSVWFLSLLHSLPTNFSEAPGFPASETVISVLSLNLKTHILNTLQVFFFFSWMFCHHLKHSVPHLNLVTSPGIVPQSQFSYFYCQKYFGPVIQGFWLLFLFCLLLSVF